MYRVLLVDDEPDIREGLQEVVDFASLGFEVVGEAGNGAEALRLCEALRPDLVITDIRMPLMDGLTMAAQAKKQFPTMQFVILSGYDEFEYARQAIELTALRYLLKPISSQEFIAIMQDVKRRMDEDLERRADLTRLRSLFASSLPILRETLLSSVVAGEVSEAQALQLAARYGMQLAGKTFALALLRMQQGDDAEQPAPVISDPELLSFAARNIADEVLEGRAEYYIFHYNGLLAIFLQSNETGDAAFSDFMDTLQAVQLNISHYLKCHISIGVGVPCSSLSQLPTCARQAHAAVNQASLVEEGQVLCITDMVPHHQATLAVDEYSLRVLGNSLKQGNAQQARATVATLLDACRDHNASIAAYRAYLLEILMVFIRTGRDMDMASPGDLEQNMLEQLMLCPPVPEAERIFSAMCQQLTRSVLENRTSSSRLLAQKAEDYLRENYAQEDLSIEKLCLHLHISTSYFSAIFKKETQKTFLQYLTELRMDRAMSLLVSSDLRTAEIARNVGISDPAYFSYTFKRHFGISPSQVRKRMEAAT